jgi:hypothetical protein
MLHIKAYYDCFGFNVVPYMSTTEILISAFANLIASIVLSITFYVLIFKIIIDHIPENSRFRIQVYLSLTIIGINSILMANDFTFMNKGRIWLYMMNSMGFISLMILMDGIINKGFLKLNEGKITPFVKFINVIMSGILVYNIILVFITTARHAAIYNINNPQKVEFFSNSKRYVTSEKIFYIGETSTHIFLHGTVNDMTSIIKKDGITEVMYKNISNRILFE